MEEETKVWVVVVLGLLLILVGGVCEQHPDEYYCRHINFYFRDPEPPVSIPKIEITSFSMPYSVGTSTATTTTS